jgi:hypothetical protein
MRLAAVVPNHGRSCNRESHLEYLNMLIEVWMPEQRSG